MTIGEIILLEFALEDYTGLFEASGIYIGRLPISSEAERGQTAKASVRSLLQDGYVALYRSAGLRALPAYTEIAPSQWQFSLENPVEWEAPLDDYTPYVCFAATPMAEKQFYHLVEVQGYFRKTKC